MPSKLEYEHNFNKKNKDERLKQIKNITNLTKFAENFYTSNDHSIYYELPQGYKNPVLVSTAKGVGEKLLIAQELNNSSSIGADLVALCVNHLIVNGAKPLYMLDYYSANQLNVDTAKDVIKSIYQTCLEANIDFIGGQTIETPHMYSNNNYDLAGVCIGIIEKQQLINRKAIHSGDKLIAIASNGLHTSGFRMVKNVLKKNRIGYKTMEHTLLAPTKIYAKPVLELYDKNLIKSACYIADGGFYECIPKMLEYNLKATIYKKSWIWPDVFTWLQDANELSSEFMYQNFNCGVGMILCLSSYLEQQVITSLNAQDYQAWTIGEITDNLDDIQLEFK